MPRSAKINRSAASHLARRARSYGVSGSLLCSLRVGRGWTQLEAAERAGLSERLIRKAEAGGKVGLRSVVMLAQLYSTRLAPLSPKELLTEPLGIRPNRLDKAAAIREIVRRWHDELWSQGLLGVLDELSSPDCLLHAQGKRRRGHAAVRRYIQSTRAALSDFNLALERPTIHGDLAVAQWRIQLKRAPPSMASPLDGRPSVLRGWTWIRVADGLACEVWKYWDTPPPAAGRLP